MAASMRAAATTVRYGIITKCALTARRSVIEQHSTNGSKVMRDTRTIHSLGALAAATSVSSSGLISPLFVKTADVTTKAALRTDDRKNSPCKYRYINVLASSMLPSSHPRAWKDRTITAETALKLSSLSTSSMTSRSRITALSHSKGLNANIGGGMPPLPKMGIRKKRNKGLYDGRAFATTVEWRAWGKGTVESGSDSATNWLDTTSTAIDALELRARVKLEALESAKLAAAAARRLDGDDDVDDDDDDGHGAEYAAATLEERADRDRFDGDNDICTSSEETYDGRRRRRRKELFECEERLARAYRQAIKYVARTKGPDAASRAQALLNEMLNGTRNDSPTLPPPPSSTSLLPTKREFHNVLHAWASSKARKKGVHAESLLLQMADLSLRFPRHFPPPDSKAFALVVKCHAGSTHSQSLQRIVHLHELHDSYADSPSSYPDIFRHDPYFLMCSLKSLRNYRDAREFALADRWLSQLHAFVMDPMNEDYDKDDDNNDNGDGDGDGDGDDLAVEADHNDDARDRPIKAKIDLTGTYTLVIRELARMRGAADSSGKAQAVLKKMHELSDGKSAIATACIKSNAYDLVLSSFRDCKSKKHKKEALAMLNQMITLWKESKQRLDANAKSKDTCSSFIVPIPAPTERSFELVIQTLAGISDKVAAREEVRRLLSEFESMCDSGAFIENPTTAVHNAAMESYTKIMSKDANLVDEVDKVLRQMENPNNNIGGGRGNSIPAPDAASWSHLIKAYSLVEGDEDVRRIAFEKVGEVFKKLELYSDSSMNDNCYYNMMKCVINLDPDVGGRSDKIFELFSGACERGLVSANVLRMFKHHVSDEVYTAKVGSGRLADNWVANVTSGKALYTDGTIGGAGKNARRKGKSTSDWTKKQKMKEERKKYMEAKKNERKRIRQAQRRKADN